MDVVPPQRQNPCPEQPGGLDAVAPDYLFGGLLAQIQTRVLYFFWDGQHWVPQGVLFPPGQQDCHLQSAESPAWPCLD